MIKDKIGVVKMERYLSDEFINNSGGVSFAIDYISRHAANGDIIYVGDAAQKVTVETYLVAENKKDVLVKIDHNINSYDWMKFSPTDFTMK